MEKNSSKNIILTIIFCFVLLIVVFGFTYAFFRYSRTSVNEHKVSAGTIKLGYIEGENGINLVNALPTSDTDALATSNRENYFDFHITYDISEKASLTYEIDIENITNSLDEVKNGTLTELDSSRVKIALEDRKDPSSSDAMVVGATYFNGLTTTSSNGKAGYSLYTREVSGSGNDFFRLYLWIPEIDSNNVEIPLIDYNIDGVNVMGIKNQAFSVRINVQAVAIAK